MDIFIINAKSYLNIEKDLLNDFQHKEFSNNEKKFIHCFSYLMLDRILKEVYKIENRNLLLKNKKPFLENNQKFFSISHSNEYIAIVCSDFECGIDIEKIKQRNYKKIAQRMNFNCNSLENFYKEWTKFEALYKLGQKTDNLYEFKYENYQITVASASENEKFELYIQNTI